MAIRPMRLRDMKLRIHQNTSRLSWVPQSKKKHITKRLEELQSYNEPEFSRQKCGSLPETAKHLHSYHITGLHVPDNAKIRRYSGY